MVKVSPDENAKIDQELENGPVNKRHCTDILCCLLFLASIGAMIGIAAYGFANGDPSKLLAGYDPDGNEYINVGNACGVSTKTKDFKYIFFVTPTTNYLHRRVCVSECPTNVPTSGVYTLKCVPNSVVISCATTASKIVSGFSFSSVASASLSTSIFAYDSEGYLGKVCMPNASILSSVNISTGLDMGTLEKWLHDLQVTWEILLASIGFALVIGFVYMIILRFFAGILTWIAILTYHACLVVIGIFFYLRATETSTNTDSTSSTQNSDTLKIWAYISWGVAALSFLIFICMFKRIRLAIAIIKTASVFLRDVPFALLVSPVMAILVCIFWVAWFISIMYVYSVGEFVKTTNSQSPFASVKWNDTTRYSLIYFLFGGLWKNAFLQALNQFIIASAVAIWYFSQGPGQGLHKPISRSIYRAFRYHLGSLAFGSLILAIVQMIRLVLTYVQKQMEKTGQSNRIIKFMFTCLQCYMACFERFIRFLNKVAYIQIAITGKNFCISAKNGFFLLLKNPARMSFTHGLGEIYIFIGKLFVSIASALLAYLIITKVSRYSDNITSPILPTIVCFIISFGIAIMFMSTYGMAIDTILQCFILDEELNKEKGRDPQYTPPLLQDFMSKHDKKS